MRPVRLHVKLRHAVLAAAVLLVGAVAAAQPVAPVEPDTDRALRDVIETIAAVSDGIYDADQARAIPGATDFRTWCREVLRPAAR